MGPKVMILTSRRAALTWARRRNLPVMRALAEQGTVLIMISSDMEEILHVSDRVAVMHEGEITGVLERSDCTEENVHAIGGRQKDSRREPAFVN